MKNFVINTVPGFDQWRAYARDCLAARIPPHDIIWHNADGRQPSLFTPDPSPNIQDKQTEGYEKPSEIIKISNEVLECLKIALCHSDVGRFDLCYRVLWRIQYKNKNLLKLKTDNDVIKLTKLTKAVHRDAYKITAFLRFREINHDGIEHFIAWYEPEHYSLELKLGFFQTRFKNMHWSILTPYRAAHWNCKTLTLEDNPDPYILPKDDKVEQYWLTYYANIFNPARVKKAAMLSQMPQKYWKNMPETRLINDLIRHSETNAREMINKASDKK